MIADDFASRPDGLVAMVAPATRDRIIEYTLGNPDLARDVYVDLREKVIRAPERWHDLNVSIALAPWDGGPASGRGSMFIATVRYEYKTVPSSPVMRFAAVSSITDYREQLQDPTIAKVWYFEKLEGVADAASPEAFELTQFAVDGRPRPARRASRAGTQTYTVNLGAEAVSAGHEVTVSYTYRALVQRSGHLFNLDVARPAKGLRVQLFYGGCGIRHINTSDYIASATPVRISQSAADEPTPFVELSFDGLVFPKAGVAFVWVLDEEIAMKFRRP